VTSDELHHSKGHDRRLRRPERQSKQSDLSEFTEQKGVGPRTDSTSVSNSPSADPLEPSGHSSSEYRVVDFTKSGATLDAARFYDDSYRRTLSTLVDQVISVEGPVYFDVLVTRVARAHGFQRSGNNIQGAIMAAVDQRFPRTREDNRVVLWPVGATVATVVEYRSSSNRPYTDVPLAELAGLAGAYLSLRMPDVDVLRRMGEHFQLGRLRETAKLRFEAAIALAKREPTSPV
jgi:hypothetical protein